MSLRKYQTESDAADALAVAKGWQLREGWSIEWASDCECWFEGSRQMVERLAYFPFADSQIVALMRRHDLNIKPTWRKVRGGVKRLWHVQSTDGAYRKHFMSDELYDAVAQWLVGYYEFQQLLKSKVDCV